MKSISAWSTDMINSNVQEIDLLVSKDDWVTEEFIQNDVIAIEWYTELANDYWILTRDSMNLIVSNTTSDHQPYSAEGKYSNTLILQDEINCYVKYWVQPYISLLKWFIFEITWLNKNSTSEIKMISQKEITEKITINSILNDQKPYQLVQYIVETILWKTFQLNWNTTDEDDRVIKYTSYYEDSAFDELNSLCEYARSSLFYDSYSDKYIYSTETYIDSKSQSATPEDYEVTNNTLMDYTTRVNSDNLLNLITWSLNSYEIKNNWTPYIFTVALEAWESYSVKQKLWEWEYYSNYWFNLADATTWEDWSWDNYAIIDPSVITHSETYYPNWIEATYTNTHTEKLYCTIEVTWTWLIPNQSEKFVWDSTSITTYWEKREKIRNKYFQDQVYLLSWLNKHLSENKDPKVDLNLDIVWNPALQLMDKIKFISPFEKASNGITAKQYMWLIKRIGFNFDLQWWFTMWVTLKVTSTN